MSSQHPCFAFYGNTDQCAPVKFFDACFMYMALVMDIEKSFTSKKISFAQNQYSLLQPFCALHNFVCVFDEYSLKKKMCIALFL